MILKRNLISGRNSKCTSVEFSKTKGVRSDIANVVPEHSKMMDTATELHYKSLLQLIKYVLYSNKEYTLKMKPRVDENI